MDKFNYNQTDYSHLPDVSDQARKCDMVFMVTHALETEKIPMWCGFNARIHKDEGEKQVVHYMPNLSQPITRNDVVAETMRISMKCASECWQTYGLVTYDLDVANIAHKIQISEQPEFDRLFIMFGVFHIFICFFRAIGRIIAESGGPAMLTDTDVLAPGSLRGFIECKSYNRCRRLHPMLALAFEILLYRRFITDYDQADELHNEMKNYASQFEKKKEVDDICDSPTFMEVFREYEKYKRKTEDGALGKTAQFWAMYMRYIQMYHFMQRAVRENNIILFISTLTTVTDSSSLLTGRIIRGGWPSTNLI